MRVMSIMPLIRNLPIGEMVQFNPADESYARGACRVIGGRTGRIFEICIVPGGIVEIKRKR